MPSRINGTGTTHFGKSNYVEDKENEMEEFDTTLWFSLFWLPVIPLKSYRIRQQIWYVRSSENVPKIGSKDMPMGLSFSNSFTIVAQYKLNWAQIIKTYLLAYGIILILFIVLIFVSYFKR
jgi:hypothetical protein